MSQWHYGLVTKSSTAPAKRDPGHAVFFDGRDARVIAAAATIAKAWRSYAAVSRAAEIGFSYYEARMERHTAEKGEQQEENQDYKAAHNQLCEQAMVDRHTIRELNEKVEELETEKKAAYEAELRKQAMVDRNKIRELNKKEAYEAELNQLRKQATVDRDTIRKLINKAAYEAELNQLRKQAMVDRDTIRELNKKVEELESDLEYSDRYIARLKGRIKTLSAEERN